MITNQTFIKVIITLIVFFWSLSIHFGTFDLGIHVFGIIFFGIYHLFKTSKALKSQFIGIILIGLFSVTTGIFNSSPEGYNRIINSSILFVLTQLSLISIASFSNVGNKFILKDNLLVFIIILSLIADIFILNPGLSRVGGLFKEPSHLAISIIPFLYTLYQKKESNYKFIIFIIIPILALSFSSTFILAFLFLLSLHKFRENRIKFLVYLLIVISPLLFVLFSYVDYINQRVLGVLYVSATSNVSSLVYIYGWESLFYYIKESFGFGIGINGMGVPPFPDVETANLLASKDGRLYSNPDGSFMFSKFISELGFIGLFIFLLGIKLIIKSIKYYNQYTPFEQFLWNSLVLLIFTSFIRGVGYFDGPFIIGSLAYFTLVKKGKRLELT